MYESLRGPLISLFFQALASVFRMQGDWHIYSV